MAASTSLIWSISFVSFLVGLSDSATTSEQWEAIAGAHCRRGNATVAAFITAIRRCTMGWLFGTVIAVSGVNPGVLASDGVVVPESTAPKVQEDELQEELEYKKSQCERLQREKQKLSTTIAELESDLKAEEHTAANQNQKLRSELVTEQEARREAERTSERLTKHIIDLQKRLDRQDPENEASSQKNQKLNEQQKETIEKLERELSQCQEHGRLTQVSLDIAKENLKRVERGSKEEHKKCQHELNQVKQLLRDTKKDKEEVEAQKRDIEATVLSTQAIQRELQNLRIQLRESEEARRKAEASKAEAEASRKEALAAQENADGQIAQLLEIHEVELSKLQAKIGQLKFDKECILNELGEANGRFDERYNQECAASLNSDNKNELGKLQAENVRLTQQCKDLHEKQKYTEGDVQTLKRENNQLKRDLEACKKRHDDLVTTKAEAAKVPSNVEAQDTSEQSSYEISALKKELEASNKAKAALHDQIQVLTRQYEGAQQTLTEQAQSLLRQSILQDENNRLKENLATFQRHYNTLQTQFTDAADNRQSCETALAGLQSEIDALKQEKISLESQLRETEVKVSNFQQELLSATGKAAQTTPHDERYKNLKNEHNNLKLTLNEERKESQKIRDQNASLAQQLSQSQSAQVAIRDNHHRDLRSSEEIRRQQEAQITDLSANIQALQNQITDYDNRTAQAQSQSQQLVKDLLADNQDLTDQVNQRLEELKNLDAQISEIQNKLDKAVQENARLNAELNNVGKGSERAQIDHLSGRVQHLIAENETLWNNNFELQNQLQNAQNPAQVTQDEIGAVTARLQQVQEYSDSLSRQMKAVVDAYPELEAELAHDPLPGSPVQASTSQRAEDQSLSQLKEKLKAETDLRQQTEIEKDMYQSELEEVNDELTRARRDQEGASNRVLELERQLAERPQAQQNYMAEMARLRRTQGEYDKMMADALSNQWRQAEERAAVEQQKQLLESLQACLDVSDSKVKSLEEESEELRAVNRGLQTQLRVQQELASQQLGDGMGVSAAEPSMVDSESEISEAE